jgi:hypothetical protein
MNHPLFSSVYTLTLIGRRWVHASYFDSRTAWLSVRICPLRRVRILATTSSPATKLENRVPTVPWLLTLLILEKQFIHRHQN